MVPALIWYIIVVFPLYQIERERDPYWILRVELVAKQRNEEKIRGEPPWKEKVTYEKIIVNFYWNNSDLSSWQKFCPNYVALLLACWVWYGQIISNEFCLIYHVLLLYVLCFNWPTLCFKDASWIWNNLQLQSCNSRDLHLRCILLSK